MKKSRRVRINGEDYRYFVDNGAVDEDGLKFFRVILYATDGGMFHWNLSEKIRWMTPATVKNAFKDGKFLKVR